MTAAIANLPAVAVPARLPMPATAAPRGITPAQWRVLVDAIYPSAQSPESILMACDYCRARDLDVFKKPVHIVPMWSSALKKMVETIWPGINEVQITAARTGAWAGMDAPKWGPIIRRVFKGSKKVDNNWKPVVVEVQFPEWCEVTVYRLIHGQRCPFSEPVFWEEAYSTAGGKDSELPTDMWVKRPRGQLQKVAKAAALRAAFPEEGELCAEEMEGKVIEAGGAVIEHEAMPELPPPPAPPKAEKPPLMVAIGEGWDPVQFPRGKKGLREALEFMTGAVVDGKPQVVALNNQLLDDIATHIPELAEEVSELRAAAAEALRPKDEPDNFVQEFLGEDTSDVFPGDLPSKQEG